MSECQNAYKLRSIASSLEYILDKWFYMWYMRTTDTNIIGTGVKHGSSKK